MKEVPVSCGNQPSWHLVLPWIESIFLLTFTYKSEQFRHGSLNHEGFSLKTVQLKHLVLVFTLDVTKDVFIPAKVSAEVSLFRMHSSHTISTLEHVLNSGLPL